MEAQLDREALHDAALHNLVERTREKQVRLVPAGSFWALLWDGNFEATLMLHADLWGELERRIGGPLAVAVPSRDVPAIGRADAREGLDALRGVVDRVWNGGSHLLVRDLCSEDGWHLL